MSTKPPLGTLRRVAVSPPAGSETVGRTRGGSKGRGESGSDFFVSALVVMLVVGIVTIKFSGKLFRPEATLAVVLTVVTVAGWIWRMPRGGSRFRKSLGATG